MRSPAFAFCNARASPVDPIHVYPNAPDGLTVAYDGYAVAFVDHVVPICAVDPTPRAHRGRVGPDERGGRPGGGGSSGAEEDPADHGIITGRVVDHANN